MSRARLGLYVFARVSLFKNCFELTPAFDQLMRRTLKLQLLPHESYPTDRPNDAPPFVPPMEIEDMPHMAKFVYDYYMNKVNGMKVQIYETQKEWQEPGVMKAAGSPTHRVSAHPGADDTDDEEEQDQDQEQANPIARSKQEPVEKMEETQKPDVEEAAVSPARRQVSAHSDADDTNNEEKLDQNQEQTKQVERESTGNVHEPVENLMDEPVDES